MRADLPEKMACVEEPRPRDLALRGFTHATTRATSDPSPSSAAMSAMLTALEGVTKEVARLRARTSQLGDRGAAADQRLTGVEEQVAKIRNRMKQLRVRTFQPEPSLSSLHRSRCPDFASMTQQSPHKSNGSSY